VKETDVELRKFASGRWQVKAGQEDDFVDRWTAWLIWTRDTVPGFRSAKLLRSDDDADRFTSVSDWDDAASAREWKMTPGFAERLARVRETCDEFIGGDFDLVAEVEAHE
jgi:heme-degrading monooxygenase HmoA